MIHKYFLRAFCSVNRTKMAKTVKLSSGYHMPLMGLGMWQTDSQELVDAALEAAIEADYRHIDTAFAYKNESFIGKTLHRLFQSGKVKREDLFIVSKLPMYGMKPDAVDYFFKKSLTALQLDYLDLYLVHGPLSSKRSEDDDYAFPLKDGVYQTDESVDLVETWKCMESLVNKGFVRSIGISNFNSQQIQRVYDAAQIKPANLQVECHAYLPQYELQEFCRKLNIHVTAYSPLGTPGLAEFARKHFGVDVKLENLLQDERLEPLAVKHGKTPAQILLRYLVQRRASVIPKSSNPVRIKENIQVFDFTLEEEDMAVLKSMGKNYRYFVFDNFPGMKSHPEYPFHIPY